MPSKIVMLKVVDLEPPGLSQSRVAPDPETIEKYKAAWKSGNADFPAIIVFQDASEKYHIADGFHRAQSLMLAEIDLKMERRKIAADIRSGTIEDAIAFSLGANLRHGLLPSTADKKRAILLYYGLNPEHCTHANNKVAQAIGCSHTFVGGWKTTCITMPASITAAETNIPLKILEQTIANLKTAVAEGKIVTTRNGKQLVQATKNPASTQSLKSYIFTNPNDCIPRGKIVKGFDSLTDPGHISVEWDGSNLLILVSDAIEIPYPIGSKVNPIGEDIELIIDSYALVGSDLKVKSIDLFGFAHTHSSTTIEPFIKKTLANPVVVADPPENNIDAAELPTTPILNLLSLTDAQLFELQFNVEQETLRRARLSEDTADLAIS